MVGGVLFVMDNPHRELRGIACIAERLRQRGVPAALCGKSTLATAYNLHRPRLAVLPRITTDMATFARSVAGSTIICVIPSEHGSGFRDKVLNNAVRMLPDGRQPHDAAPEVVSRVYVAGENQETWLADAGIYDEARMLVVGTLNSDHWLVSGRRTRAASPRIGIATTNKSILYGLPIRSIPEIVNQHRTQDWNESLWRIDLAAFELAHTLVLTDALDVIKRMNQPVSIRPHPHEYVEHWAGFVARQGDGVSLNRSLRLDKWLAGLSACIATFSTVTLDSIAHDVPCISLEAMIPERYAQALPPEKKPMPSIFSWNPKSRDELRDLLEKAVDGVLPSSPHPAEAAEFMKRNFLFPRDHLACDAISDDILALLDRGAQARPDHDRRPGVPLARHLSYYLRCARAYVRDPRRENQYFPFNLRQNQSARKYCAELLRDWNRDAPNRDRKLST